MSRLLNKAILASFFFGLILLAGSGARAAETPTGNVDTLCVGFGGLGPCYLQVGDTASGSYTVDGGSMVSQYGLDVGAKPNGNGQVTVTGSGTTLSLGFDGPSSSFADVSLSVGEQGVGVMTISGGAVVDSNISCPPNKCFSVVGQTAGSTGSMTLTDPGSRLVTATHLGIGVAGVFELPTSPNFSCPGTFFQGKCYYGAPGGSTTA
jgi:T5SS/PEP-CTERM-associated repeat protein